MSPDTIRLELFKRRKNIKMADIARNLGVSNAAVSRVIDRLSRSERIQQAVADAIQRPMTEVFPENNIKLL